MMMNTPLDRRRQLRTELLPVNVEITLACGPVIAGRLFIPPGRGLADVLNGEAAFLEFQPFTGGGRRHIAKSSVVSVARLVGPDDRNLAVVDQTSTALDPHQTLGVRPEATPDEIARAYAALRRTYDPERFVGCDLPEEVAEYLANRATRIERSWAALRENEPARLRPVYESRPRPALMAR